MTPKTREQQARERCRENAQLIVDEFKKGGVTVSGLEELLYSLVMGFPPAEAVSEEDLFEIPHVKWRKDYGSQLIYPAADTDGFSHLLKMNRGTLYFRPAKENYGPERGEFGFRAGQKKMEGGGK